MKPITWICLLFLSVWGFPNTGQHREKEDGTYLELVQNERFLTTIVNGNELYLNIPPNVLDQPMLFIRYDQSLERKYMQVVWTLEQGRILLKVPRIHSSAGVLLPLKQNRALKENILAVFPLEKEGNHQDGLWINLTDLILHQDIEWTPGFSENLIPQITLLLGTKNLYDEIIIKTRRGMVKNGSKVSIPVFFGFYALGKPMKGRLYDYRMGFYNEDMGGIDYDNTKNSIANISRWRLEKKQKDKEMSTPVKPITFVLSPDIPKKWRPYIKAGIEEWLPAFESAGFKNALNIKEVDSLTDWQVYSLHYSVVHWRDARYLRGFEESGGTVSNIVDFRTGEILKGDIHLGASDLNLAEEYFIRCAPLDERAKQFPFPDDLIGALFQSLTAHEAGHAFGLMDSNYGEFTYPFEKMNDSNWLGTMGHTPSIMNYARENNIAQPEDSIRPALLIPKVGPMDRYQINWAYREFPIEFSKNEEEAALEDIIRLQDTVPWYRYNNSKYEVIGPAACDEVVETNNPVESTKLAIKNLRRVMELLPGAVKNQKDNARLERLYNGVLELWQLHMRHVLSMIGGYDIQYKSIDQPGSMYTPIDLENQEEALDFLITYAFNPPDWLVDPIFNHKLQYSTYPDRVLEYQQRLVIELLRAHRLKRFEYLETMEGYRGFYPRFLINLQKGLFRELYGDLNSVERRRQEVQSTYIDRLIQIVTYDSDQIVATEKTFDYTNYSKGLMMSQLETLRQEIVKWIKRHKGNDAMGHWKLCLSKLDSVLL